MIGRQLVDKYISISIMVGYSHDSSNTVPSISLTIGTMEEGGLATLQDSIFASFRTLWISQG